jgi:hypothetical protein
MGRRVLLSICVAPIVALAWMPSVAGAETQAASPCAGVDPYTLTPTQLQACGYEVFPLVKVEEIAYGGKAYIYNLPSGRVTVIVPPSSFDPVTASQQELEAFGYPPPPPKGSEAYELWLRIMETSHPAEAPPFMIEGPGRKRGPGKEEPTRVNEAPTVEGKSPTGGGEAGTNAPNRTGQGTGAATGGTQGTGAPHSGGLHRHHQKRRGSPKRRQRHKTRHARRRDR